MKLITSIRKGYSMKSKFIYYLIVVILIAGLTTFINVRFNRIERALNSKNCTIEKVGFFRNNITPISFNNIKRIAHGAGGFNQQAVTNSIEAIESNKDKFDLFEIDFNFTKDNRLVCTHDLDKESTYQDFINHRSKNRNFTPMVFEELTEWLDKNPTKSIVTDVKDDNLKALTYIKEHYKEYASRVIPQIYCIEEYEPVKKLGYKNIIFTLYRNGNSDATIVSSIRGKDLYAVTIYKGRAPFLATAITELGIPVYAHTVNSNEVFDFLRENYGVTEIYTDFLY